MVFKENRARDARINSASIFVGKEKSFSFEYEDGGIKGKYVLSIEYEPKFNGKELVAIVVSEYLGSGLKPVCREDYKNPENSLNPKDLPEWLNRARQARG